MPSSKSGKRQRSFLGWFRRVLENLLSQITWLDFSVGLGFTVVISLLLVRFWHQPVPVYKLHDIATQDVRALLDISYEDSAATEKRREAARASVPVLYELDTNLISGREGELSRSFSKARSLLARKNAGSKGKLSDSEQAEILQELHGELGGALPASVMPLFLRERFSTALEGKVLKVLDAVLRDGIISDRAQFLQDQHGGIMLREGSNPFERPLTDAYMVRDLAAAREYLNQFHLEFSDLPSGDRVVLVQFLEGMLVPTLLPNERDTRLRRDQASARVPVVETHVPQGKIIVRRGEEVTQNILGQLEALANLQRPRSLFWQWCGFFFFAVTFVYALWRYFVYYQDRHQKIRNHMVLILCVVIVGLAVMRLSTALADVLSEQLPSDTFHDPFNLYTAIPFAFSSILVTLLVDVNLGIIVSVILSTLTGLYYGDMYLGSYALIGSLTGIYSIRQYKDRAAILKAGLTIGVVNSFALVGIELLKDNPVRFANDFSRFGLAMLGGVLAAALASMLLPALESSFRITTDIRLLELSNLNAPMLRRLAVEAPGTYHHSLMVGTLAEAAAEAVGANPLLVRVGAYYHDLGKLVKPEYFVENQIFGINKHEALSPSMSCLIIASHIRDGLDMAAEIGLPERIRDMIPQHHGTRIMTYFYQKAKDAPDTKNQEIVEADYRYPGPKPQTKEAAIIMMADSVEAASRTISNPTAAQIQGMVNRLVDAIVGDNQIDECDLTLREVRLVKESFFKILTGIYHHRIDYPGYDFSESVSGGEAVSAPNSDSRQAKAI